MAQAQLKQRREITDEKRIEFFTRLYDADAHYKASPLKPEEAANDNHIKHAWPVRDDALANDLMTGRDAAHTAWLNAQALLILWNVRHLVETTTPACDWLRHGVMELDGEEEPYGTGFGIEVKRDYGPSEEKLKELFADGAEISAEGEPWNVGPCELLETTSALGEAVKALRRAGALQFNERGHLTHFKINGRWLRLFDRTRGAKGERAQKPPSKPAQDACLYKAAAMPWLHEPFLAGKVLHSQSLASSGPHSDPGSSDSKNRPPQSAHDPVFTEQADERATNNATEALSSMRGLLGRRPYEARC